MMLVLTTEVLPEGFHIKEIHGLVEATYPVQITEDGIMRGLMDRDRADHVDAIEAFKKAARQSANGKGNLLFGVRVSTSTASFQGETFLYLTYCGTLATCEMQC